jgi:acyl-CoA reductase-like NAD-dependent aldehyde dehydrogenase
MSTERIIVVKAVVPQLLQHIKLAMRDFPSRFDMITERAAKRTYDLLSDALEKGAVLEIGQMNDMLHDASMAPSIISGLKPNMELFTTESFGPSVALIEVEDVFEAVEIANNSFYGLSASIFSSNIGRAIAVGKTLQSGAVHINSMTLHDEATLPHGGVKDSGYGRFGGRWGISCFVQSKNILVHGIKI